MDTNLQYGKYLERLQEANVCTCPFYIYLVQSGSTVRRVIPYPSRVGNHSPYLFRPLHCFADESAVGPLAKEI